MAEVSITFFDGKRQVIEGVCGQDLNGNRYEMTMRNGDRYIFNYDYIIGLYIKEEDET